jgi:hypothetical protein
MRTALLLALLSVAAGIPCTEVIRGPYVQLTTNASAVVRWRTRVATATRLQYGSSASDLHTELRAASGLSTATTDHLVQLRGALSSPSGGQMLHARRGHSLSARSSQGWLHMAV